MSLTNKSVLSNYRPINYGDLDPSPDRGSQRRLSVFPKSIAVFCISVLVAGIGGFTFYSASTKVFDWKSSDSAFTAEDTMDVFDENGRFYLRNYDTAKPMASFLPGLGGKFGMPMWAFYVNRGQAIAAFGTETKEHPLMEFNPANKAYQDTSAVGFRTFLKIKRGEKEVMHQPFYVSSVEGTCSAGTYTRDLLIGMNELEIQEDAIDLGLKTKVQYFTIPDEDFAALVRRTTFTNSDLLTDMTIEVLDGMPKIEPFGVNDWALKNMGRTLEAWCQVYNYEDSGYTLPFYKLSASIEDTEEVTMIDEGNWMVSYVEAENEVMDGTVHSLLPIIADPAVVFGSLDTPLNDPVGLKNMSLEELLQQTMITVSRTPTAFAAGTFTLKPGESVTVTSVFGRSKDQSTFTDTIAPTVTQNGYVAFKQSMAIQLTEDFTALVHTETSNEVFDAMVRQIFLDNFLRGGLPLMLGGINGAAPKVYHTFSRIHGDLERDYNYFVLDLTYFSQGPGAFRDVNQNRRSDVLLDPRVGDFNIRTFLSFVQSDGYNPLTVATTQFVISSIDNITTVVNSATTNNSTDLFEILQKPFRPGDLFADMTEKNVTLTMDREEFVDLVASVSVQVPQGNFSQNGFWADHWTYNLDLVDSYLTIYPEKKEELLFDSDPIPFYLSPAQVNPRSKKYVLVDEIAGTVRQYGCMAGDTYKADALKQMETLVEGNWMRYPIDDDNKHADDSSSGLTDTLTDATGEVFKVSIASKLMMLAVVKFSTLDPYGMGVEMEGGKPGWNDAMNGLPALIGSGMPETFELLRLLYFVNETTSFGRSVIFPSEFSDMFSSILDEVDGYVDDFTYWDNVATARELYRTLTTYQFSGDTQEWASSNLQIAFESMIAKVESGIEKAKTVMNGFTPTYFSYDVTAFEYVLDDNDAKLTDSEGRPYVNAKAFAVHTYPQFLEGNVRYFKVLKDKDSRLELYQETRNGPMYDVELKMYRLSDSLDGQSYELGRMMAFPPGWLENSSIWLHMSYKFYLELLRGELYSEFWEEVQTGMTAFMDPNVFGRSPLEAASFIVSSAYPDSTMHGSGYLARLSGSTAEFLSMWTLMMQGPTPFLVDSTGNLVLKLKPALPGWLFKEDGTVTFMFLGKAVITYHNPSRTDSWELGDPITAGITSDSGESVTLDLVDGIIPAPYANSARNLELATIDIYFG